MLWHQQLSVDALAAAPLDPPHRSHALASTASPYATDRVLLIVNNNTVHRCSDGVVCFWINGNDLFREGGHPVFYFDEAERREELAGLAAENEIDQTIADELFPELASDKIA
jgi:hypothetical protein